MRCGNKRLAFALAATTFSIIVPFSLFYRPILFVRYQREDGQRLGRRDPIAHALQNCSCYMNFIRNNSYNDSVATTLMTNVSAKNRTAIEHTSVDIFEEPNTKPNTKLLTPPISQNVKSAADAARFTERAALYLQEPVDKHLYGYIHNPERTCFYENGTKMDIYLVFFVPSAPGNFDLRQAIRRSYGKRDTWPPIDGAHVVTVFLLGSTSDGGIQERVDSESGDYGDIVQESFHDSYLNLTRKTVMGLKWVSNHCRHARFTMKIDDDTTVVQRRVLRILQDASRMKYVIGYVFKTPIVDRNKRSKFYMSKEYYPDDHFPAYAVGAGYIMSTDVVEEAFNVAITIPIFPWEDVFVGMCFHKVGMELNHDGGFLFRDHYRYALTANVDAFSQKYSTVTGLDKSNMVRIYERFMIKRS